GDRSAITDLTPVMQALAVGTYDANDGWLNCGNSGSGHFTKMIHNGIEYGMMQAFAEGFALLEGRKDLDLDLSAIAQLWRHGSVVRSWLLDLTAEALSQPGNINSVGPVVADSGEGRWTVDKAVRQGVPAPVIAAALMSRFDSQGKADTTNQLLSLMRRGFGGHATVDPTT
ncbi:MAG: 6-phosphogluconate dehydrogenase (decarboxylating), partial [Burkholderiaceae bacterium]